MSVYGVVSSLACCLLTRCTQALTVAGPRHTCTITVLCTHARLDKAHGAQRCPNTVTAICTFDIFTTSLSFLAASYSKSKVLISRKHKYNQRNSNTRTIKLKSIFRCGKSLACTAIFGRRCIVIWCFGVMTDNQKPRAVHFDPVFPLQSALDRISSLESSIRARTWQRFLFSCLIPTKSDPRRGAENCLQPSVGQSLTSDIGMDCSRIYGCDHQENHQKFKTQN